METRGLSDACIVVALAARLVVILQGALAVASLQHRVDLSHEKGRRLRVLAAVELSRLAIAGRCRLRL